MPTQPLIPWRLDAATPSSRCQTLVHLLGCADDDPRVVEARRALMATGPVPAILAPQTQTGQWADEHSYYTPKYVSTHWSLTLLTELDVDGDDPRFRRGVDFMLERTAASLQRRFDTHTLGLSCFWSNLLRYASHARAGDDPQFGLILGYMLQDVAEGPCRCAYNDGHACAWGVARTLWGLAALPDSQRSGAVNQAIEQGVGFLLDSFSLAQANYPTPDNGKVHPLWSRLNFPLFYQADILFTLRTLAALGALDRPGAQPALDWLEARCQANGRWRGSSPYRARTWAELGDSQETDRWVSLQAARILQQAGRSKPVH